VPGLLKPEDGRIGSALTVDARRQVGTHLMPITLEMKFDDRNNPLCGRSAGETVSSVGWVVWDPGGDSGTEPLTCKMAWGDPFPPPCVNSIV